MICQYALILSFIFYISGALRAGCFERQSLPGRANFYNSKWLPCICAFICKLTNPESMSPNHLLCGPLTLPATMPLQLGVSPTPWSLLKLFKLANPKPAYLALLIPSYTNHNKGSCPHVPSSFCLLTQPNASPCGPEW